MHHISRAKWNLLGLPVRRTPQFAGFAWTSLELVEELIAITSWIFSTLMISTETALLSPIWGSFFVAKSEDAFSWPLASKITTSKEEVPINLKSSRSLSSTRWASTNSFQPDARIMPSGDFVTPTCQILPLGGLRSTTSEIFSLKRFAKFFGIVYGVNNKTTIC